MKKLVIFDLDGTLMDTVADLACSTNYALGRCGFPTHETEKYRYFVGNGINRLFERALPEGEKNPENILCVREAFLPHYNKHGTDKSAPYPGIPELLEALQEQGVMLAVASNKYHAATCGLIAHYFPDIRFAAVFGQREGTPIKPDPAVISDIIEKIGVKREEVLYVGDSGVDMQTAGNAGVDAVGVTWGFRPREELERFSPRHIVNAPQEILNLV